MSIIVSESNAKSKRELEQDGYSYIAFISIAIFSQVTHRRVYYCYCSCQYSEMITSLLQNQTASTVSKSCSDGPSVILEFVWEIKSLKLR